MQRHNGLENEGTDAKIEIDDICSYPPSESGSDPGEKSDDSGYRGSLGKKRSASHRIIYPSSRYEFPRSQTWQGLSANKIGYKQRVAIFDKKRHASIVSEIEKTSSRQDDTGISDSDDDLKADSLESKRRSSCVKFDPKQTDLRRKSSLRNVRRVKSYIFNSVRTFVICLSLLQLCQVMGSGYGKSALTSIQRRYRLSTFKIGFLQSCFHFGNLSVILSVSYYGAKWHRPKAIAIGSLLMALSSFLSATPQFIGSRYNAHRESVSIETNSVDSALYPQALATSNTSQLNANIYPTSTNQNTVYRTGQTGYKLCRNPAVITEQTAGFIKNEENTYHGNAHGLQQEKTTVIYDVADSEPGPESGDFWDDSSLFLFIALGSVLKGMGHSPLHPLGMSFIDDYATPRNSAVYIGIVSGLSLLGPAFGFILGSLTTRTWVDYGWVNSSDVSIDPHNPMWVGAWWMGYIVTGLLLLMATIPLCLFPRVIEKEKDDETTDVTMCGFFQDCCVKDQSRLNDSDQSEKEPLECDTEDLLIEEIAVEDRDCDVAVKRDRRRNGSIMINYGLRQKCNGELDKNCNESPDTKNGKKKTHSRFPQPRNSVEFRLDDAVSTSPNDSMAKNASVYSKSNDIRIDMDSAYENCQDKKTKVETLNGHKRRRSSRLEKLALIDCSASFKGLMTDSVFLSVTFGLVFLTSFLAASITYASKYMETQFSISASFANLLNGSVNLPMVVVGNLLGGWLIRRFDLNVRRTMFIVVFGISMTIISVTGLLFFKCNKESISSYSSGTSSENCSLNCNCDDVVSPVCDPNTNITYKSPCHAGCTRVIVDGRTEIYTDCRCLLSNPDANKISSNFSSIARDSSIVPGPCNLPDCSRSHLPVFLTVMGAASLTAGVASTPSSLLILRIVPPKEKAFAIGIVFVFTRILAWIPAPVYVGYIIDSACLRWSTFSSPTELDETEQNHCEMYDKDRLRSHFFAATGGLLVLSLVFYVIAVFRHTKRMKKPRNIGRRRFLSVSNSPNFFSDSTTTNTLNPTFRSGSVATSSINGEGGRGRCNDTDEKKLSNCFEHRQLIVSSALEKPFKIAISLSAPVLANQTNNDGCFCMAPPAFGSHEIQQVTAV